MTCGIQCLFRIFNVLFAFQVYITSNYIKGSLLLMQVFCFNNRGERVYNEGKEFTELRIGFSKLTTSFEPIKNHDNPLEVVRCANILGLTVSNDLK